MMPRPRPFYCSSTTAIEATPPVLVVARYRAVGVYSLNYRNLYRQSNAITVYANSYRDRTVMRDLYCPLIG